MDKERLLKIKRRVVDKELDCWLRHVVSDDDLRLFSVAQLEKMVELMIKSRDFEEDCTPLYVMGTDIVIRKRDNAIIRIENGFKNPHFDSEDSLKYGAYSGVYEKEYLPIRKRYLERYLEKEKKETK